MGVVYFLQQYQTPCLEEPTQHTKATLMRAGRTCVGRTPLQVIEVHGVLCGSCNSHSSNSRGGITDELDVSLTIFLAISKVQEESGTNSCCSFPPIDIA